MNKMVARDRIELPTRGFSQIQSSSTNNNNYIKDLRVFRVVKHY